MPITRENVVTLTTGGGERTRTADFYVANVALCQLSYTPGRDKDSRRLGGLRAAARRHCERPLGEGRSTNAEVRDRMRRSSESGEVQRDATRRTGSPYS
jgi:hypothetical protein